MVKTKNLTLIVTAAVLAALTCVATMVVQIPMPLTKGYVNFGDVLVLTSAWLLDSPWGIAAAGIGSAMADLLTGYAYYAPATLIIKALMAVAAFYIAKSFMNSSYMKSLVGKIIGGVVAEIIMVAGYYLYAIILYGDPIAAASSIFGNVIQGAVGLIVGVLLTVALEKARVKKMLGFDK